MSNIMLAITSWLPSFDTSIDKNIRNHLVSKYSFICFLSFLIWILILLPLFNYLSLNNTFLFKIYHRFTKFIVHFPLLHRSSFSIYHNTSIKLFCVFSLIILFFSIYNNQSDFLLIAKRLGMIPSALLPITIFMTLKPSPLPNTLYLNLLPFHKWLSRSLFLSSLLHTLFFLLYFFKKHTFKQKCLLKFKNLLGLFAILTLFVVFVSSLPKFRRSNYKVFYLIHYISVWIILLTVHIHSRYRAKYYTSLSLFILFYQIFYKYRHTTTIKPAIIQISPNLCILEFPISKLPNSPILPSSHIRIILKSKNLWERLLYFIMPLTHPFTLLNLPNEDTARLLIKIGNFPLLSNHEYYVTGVYEPIINFISHKHTSTPNNPFRTNSPQLRSSPLHYVVNARRVLIFVGGSAISFGLPLLSVLNFNGVMVRLVWCVRDYRDLRLLNYLKIHYLHGLEIFISGKSQGSTTDDESDIQIDYYDSQTPLLLPNHRADNNNITGSSRQSYIGDSVDEIDFTGTDLNSPLVARTMFSNNSKDVFRKPQVINPPSGTNFNSHADFTSEEDNDRVKLPSFVKVSYGRPKLDDSYYDWCLQSECNSGAGLARNRNNDPCGTTGGEDEQCLETNLNGKDEEILSSVWVVAAGPKGLVNTTRNWASDCGLRFHGEDFTL